LCLFHAENLCFVQLTQQVAKCIAVSVVNSSVAVAAPHVHNHHCYATTRKVISSVTRLQLSLSPRCQRPTSKVTIVIVADRIAQVSLSPSCVDRIRQLVNVSTRLPHPHGACDRRFCSHLATLTGSLLIVATSIRLPFLLDRLIYATILPVPEFLAELSFVPTPLPIPISRLCLRTVAAPSGSLRPERWHLVRSSGLVCTRRSPRPRCGTSQPHDPSSNHIH